MLLQENRNIIRCHTWFSNKIFISSRGCHDHISSESSNWKIAQYFSRWRNWENFATPDSSGYRSLSWWNRTYKMLCYPVMLYWIHQTTPKDDIILTVDDDIHIHVAHKKPPIPTASPSCLFPWKPYLESAPRNRSKSPNDEPYLQSWPGSKIC